MRTRHTLHGIKRGPLFSGSASKHATTPRGACEHQVSAARWGCQALPVLLLSLPPRRSRVRPQERHHVQRVPAARWPGGCPHRCASQGVPRRLLCAPSSNCSQRTNSAPTLPSQPLLRAGQEIAKETCTISAIVVTHLNPDVAATLDEVVKVINRPEGRPLKLIMSNPAKSVLKNKLADSQVTCRD